MQIIDRFRRKGVHALVLGPVSAAVFLGMWFGAGASSPGPVATEAPIAGEYSAVPEYSRRLHRAVISLDWGRTSLDIRRSLLDRLPEYTAILLLVPRGAESGLTPELSGAPFGKRVRIVPFEPQVTGTGQLHFIRLGASRLVVEKIPEAMPLQYGALWTQDLFEPVVSREGTVRLIVPPLHLCWWTEGTGGAEKPVSDNRYLSALGSRGLKTYGLPVVFKGGNILIGEAGGKRIAFCGGDIVGETRQVRGSFPQTVIGNDAGIAELIRKALGVDRAVLVCRATPQPGRMYHLDQAMLPLADGVIAVTKINGGLPAEPKARKAVEDAIRWLAELRKELSGMGFRIVDIETPVENALRYDYPVNAVPFTHAQSGQRTLLMPVFPARTGTAPDEITRGNIARIEKEGYTVITVPSRAGSLKGGIHCLINVLD